jgi:hypothetical protein
VQRLRDAIRDHALLGVVAAASLDQIKLLGPSAGISRELAEKAGMGVLFAGLDLSNLPSRASGGTRTMRSVTGTLTTLLGQRAAADMIADALELDPDPYRASAAANLAAPMLGLQRRFAVGVRERRSDEWALLYRLNDREAVEAWGGRGSPYPICREILANRLAVLTGGRRRGRVWTDSCGGVWILETREAPTGHIICLNPWPPRRAPRLPRRQNRSQLQLLAR